MLNANIKPTNVKIRTAANKTVLLLASLKRKKNTLLTFFFKS